MDDLISVRRKKLSEIRQMLTNQTEEDPFTLSKRLSTGETISEFVVTTALHIHKKRTTKKPKV
jgi:hypothetical protein